MSGNGYETTRLFDYEPTTVRPIVKWAGGKGRILDKLEASLPDGFDMAGDDALYVEPFIGSASVLLRFSPRHAMMNDINGELVTMYEAVRDDPDAVIRTIESWPRDKDTFLRVRAMDRADDYAGTTPATTRAARFIYLNKTCFNGLYRVNSSGHFNVPYAAAQKARPDYANIRAVSTYLRDNDITITNLDYTDLLDEVAARADRYAKVLVYLDPPYDYEPDPNATNHSFDQYDATGFGRDKQLELRDAIRRLTSDHPNVLVMESNADTGFIREAYEGYDITPIDVYRSIGASSENRGNAGEVIITNYPNHGLPALLEAQAATRTKRRDGNADGDGTTGERGIPLLGNLG